MTTRVLLADDQPLMRSALRACLDAQSDLSVVGEAADGYEALELTRRTRPDVVVMDLRMPRMDGIAATWQIAGGAVALSRVLVMTTFDLDEHIVEALRAGASGFLVKSSPPEELVHAVRVVARGEALLAPSVTQRLLELRARSLAPLRSPSRDGVLAALTPRELDVLQLVARGLSNAEVAERLRIAPSSVKTHVGHLLSKLGVTDRVQLVVLAYEQAVVQPGGPVPVPRQRRPSRRG